MPGRRNHTRNQPPDPEHAQPSGHTDLPAAPSQFQTVQVEGQVHPQRSRDLLIPADQASGGSNFSPNATPATATTLAL